MGIPPEHDGQWLPGRQQSELERCRRLRFVLLRALKRASSEVRYILFMRFIYNPLMDRTRSASATTELLPGSKIGVRQCDQAPQCRHYRECADKVTIPSIQCQVSPSTFLICLFNITYQGLR